MPSLINYLVVNFGWKKLLYTASVVGLAVVFVVVTRLRNGRRQLQQPNQPASNQTAAANTTASTARQSKAREVTCAGNGVLFQDIEGAVRFLEGAEDALGRLCAKYAVYVITTVPHESCCEPIRELLRRTLVPKGLDIRKVLFSSTTKGRESIGRQILASVHIDSDELVVGPLQPHLGAVWLIDSSMAKDASLAKSLTRWTGPCLATLVTDTNTA